MGKIKKTVKNVDIKREICIEKNQESEKKIRNGVRLLI